MVKVPALPASLQVAQVSVPSLPSSQMYLGRFLWVLLRPTHFRYDLIMGASIGRHQSSMRRGSGLAALDFDGSMNGLVGLTLFSDHGSRISILTRSRLHCRRRSGLWI